MTSNKSNVPPSCASATSGLTAEHLQVFTDSDVKRRKSILRMEYEAKLRRYAEKLKQTEQRVVDLANRRQIEKLEKIARNRERFERIEKRIDAINTVQFYRKIKLNTTWKNRDRKKMKQIAKARETKVAEKHEKLLQRYFTLVENQNQKLEKNAALIDRCIVNPHLYHNDKPEMKIEEIKIQEEIQEESSEQCSYIQSAKMIPGVDRERDYGERVKIMERIENLKVKFNTCDQGVVFWEKTAPLWDRMTQCLKETLTKVKVDEPDEGYDHGNVPPVHYAPLPSLMKQVMMDDVDYNLTDIEMVEVLTSAKTLAGPNSTPAEIVHLTRRIVEHSADVKACAVYMVHGLIERSVFEFVKREVSKVMFVDMRKTVDRLQHVNDPGVIPDEPILKRDVAGVTAIVYDLIRDDSSGRFDRPVDDDRTYAEMTNHSAKRKIHEYLRDDVDDDDDSSRSESRMADVTLCPMPRRDELPEIVGQTVRRFLDLAHYKTARFLSTDHPKITESGGDGPSGGRDAISVWNVYRISRKLTKFAFDMFVTDRVKRSDEQAAADAYRTLVANRTPRIKYNRRVRPPAREMDVQFFLKRFEQLNYSRDVGGGGGVGNVLTLRSDRKRI